MVVLMAEELSKIKICPKRIIFLQKKTGKHWVQTSGTSYKIDRVLISTKWADDNLHQDNESEEENVEESEEENVEESEENSEENSEEDNVIRSTKKTIPMPGLIELKKSEKMRDNDGKIVEIEIRGTREYNNCFFLVKDVAEGFCMKNLHDTIVKKNSCSYIEGTHYIYFSKNPTISRKTTSRKTTSRKNKKIKKVKKLFLTYTGLLKVLFSSRNETVGKFIGWATQTLFTAHLGTKKQKRKLTAELMGVSVDVVNEVFNKTSSKLPVLYLLTIGKVKDLRATLNIGDEYDDEDFVAKGGETDDLTRRIKEHQNTYGKMPGVNLCLKWYNYIDPLYTKMAEKELLAILKKTGHRFDHPKFDEIIIFSKKDEKLIIRQYENISKQYIGHIKELTDKLREVDNQYKLLQKDMEIMEKDKELLKKDMELLQKDNEILRRENKSLKKKLRKK